MARTSTGRDLSPPFEAELTEDENLRLDNLVIEYLRTQYRILAEEALKASPEDLDRHRGRHLRPEERHHRQVRSKSANAGGYGRSRTPPGEVRERSGSQRKPLPSRPVVLHPRTKGNPTLRFDGQRWWCLTSGPSEVTGSRVAEGQPLGAPGRPTTAQAYPSDNQKWIDVSEAAVGVPQVPGATICQKYQEWLNRVPTDVMNIIDDPDPEWIEQLRRFRAEWISKKARKAAPQGPQGEEQGSSEPAPLASAETPQPVSSEGRPPERKAPPAAVASLVQTQAERIEAAIRAKAAQLQRPPAKVPHPGEIRAASSSGRKGPQALGQGDFTFGALPNLKRAAEAPRAAPAAKAPKAAQPEKGAAAGAPPVFTGKPPEKAPPSPPPKKQEVKQEATTEYSLSAGQLPAKEDFRGRRGVPKPAADDSRGEAAAKAPRVASRPAPTRDHGLTPHQKQQQRYDGRLENLRRRTVAQDYAHCESLPAGWRTESRLKVCLDWHHTLDIEALLSPLQQPTEEAVSLLREVAASWAAEGAHSS